MKSRLFSPDSWRLLTFGGASLLILLLLFANMHATLQLHSPHFSWLALGFSNCIALLYLAMGSIVWLYGLDLESGVAGLAFGFSLSLSATFAVETTASLVDGTLFTTISSISSGLGFMFLALFVVVFPHNWLRHTGSRRLFLLHILFAGILLAGGFTVVYALFSSRVGGVDRPFLFFVSLVSYAWLLLCSLVTMTVSYWRSTFRERQQFLFVFLGMGLSLAPFTVLTILPMTLHFSKYVIDSQLSSIPFALLPLSMCYSILRYQLIIFDRVIRVTVSRIAGVMSIALIAYLVILTADLLLPPSQQGIAAAIVAAALTPVAWQGTHFAVEHLFFREEIRYRTMVGVRALRALRVSEVCDLLLWKARETLGTSYVGLFVYESSRDEYVVPLSLLDQPKNLRYLADVVEHVQQSLGLSTVTPLSTFSLARDHALIRALTVATRPVSVHDALAIPARAWKSLLRRNPHDVLFVALPHFQDPEIHPLPGFLAFGGPSRPTGFAGPELEAMMLLVQQWSSALDTALLHEREQHHAQLQAALYLSTAQTPRPARDDVIESCLRALAQATGASVAFWQYQDDTFVRRNSVGSSVWEEERLQADQHQIWSAWFSTSGAQSAPRPSFLPRTDGWLPLITAEHHFGAITLRYPSRYLCDLKEQQILRGYAAHCAQALYSSQEAAARLHLYLQAERLQALKDQFMTEASLQLFTPLTVLRGYIELLQVGDTIPRAQYLDQALAASENLSDLVASLLRLSTLSLNEEVFSLKPVALLACLQAARTSFKEYPPTFHSAIAPDLCVTADEQSLVMALILLLTAAREERSAPTIESHARRIGETVELLVEVRGEAEETSHCLDETSSAACACLVEAMGGSFQRTTKTPTHSSFVLTFMVANSPAQSGPVLALQKESYPTHQDP